MAEIIPPLLRRQAGLYATIALLVLAMVLSILVKPASAAKSLVTVYADNQERVISTTVLTVGEALDRAGIELGEYDLVEPGVDTFINEAIFRINVYRARPITVVDGDVSKTVMSPYGSPRLIAEHAGFTVYDEDRYTMELIDDILAANALGQRLIINRAKPVTINLYGDDFVHRTHLKTVGEVLDEAGVTVGDDDKLSDARSTKVAKGMSIFVSRMGTDIISQEETVAHDIEYIYDSNMFMGQEKVKSEGKDGVDIVTYELTLENGQEVARKQIQRVTKTKPVTEVRYKGTKIADASSNIAIGQEIAANRGWTGAEWDCLYNLWMKESRWNHTASNPYSGAYGIPQALPGSKMGTVGSDWATNPVTQIQWGLGYITARYGTPCGAWSHSQSYGWY